MLLNSEDISESSISFSINTFAYRFLCLSIPLFLVFKLSSRMRLSCAFQPVLVHGSWWWRLQACACRKGSPTTDLLLFSYKFSLTTFYSSSDLAIPRLTMTLLQVIRYHITCQIRYLVFLNCYVTGYKFPFQDLFLLAGYSALQIQTLTPAIISYCSNDK